MHPGHTLEEVRDQTAFDFDAGAEVPQTPLHGPEVLALPRGPVAVEIADVYPGCARQVFGLEL